MIKSKGVLTVSMISLFAVESAYAAIASSGYVDQQVETRISEVAAAETGEGNVVSSISAEGNTVTATKGITAEETKNKVNTIRTDGTATDTAYPSEKAVATALDAKQDKLEGEVLTNTATGDGSFSTGDANVASADGAVAIGSAANAGNTSIALGHRAEASIGSGVAIGSDSRVWEYDSISIGHNAAAKASSAIVIGNGAQVRGKGAIQLGKGENSEANTFSVGLSETANYKLLGADGKIPAERLPFEGNVLTNTATASGSISTGGADPVTTSNAIAIGDLASAQNGGISLGFASGALFNGVSVGTQSSASNQAVVIGAESSARALRSITIGSFASADADYAIQLGKGENSEANTFSVGLSETANYKLLGADGKIPAERLPFTGDVLTNTATGSNSFSTDGADPVTVDNAVALGYDAIANSAANVAIGSGAHVDKEGSIAIGANTMSKGLSSTAIGYYADAANSSYGVALGANASSYADYAIQLGKGENSEANTFSVGLSDTANYKLLGADGKIPAERLPFTGNVLTNTATVSSSFSTGGAEPVVEQSSTAIGVNAAANFREAVAVGMLAVVEGDSGTAIGTNAQAYQNAVAIGKDSGANENAIGIGNFASAGADYAIQLGTGENSEANTLSVGLSDTANYKLLGADGKIPVERLPNGILTNTAAAGGFSTIPAAPAGPMSVALGTNAQALGNNAVAVGYNVQAAQSALAIGLGAIAGNTSIALGQAADASTGSGVAIGMASTVGGGATAVGTNARANAEYSVAIGLGSAASAARAIQIGQGTNSEANTLSVGFGGTNSYKLLGSDGKIPAERLPVARIPVGSETATSYASIWVE